MDSEVLIAYDVGGTNSRVSFARLEKGRAVPSQDLPEPVYRPRRGAGAFTAFVEETLGMLPKGATIAGAACAFAGPVTSTDEVCMTNWPEPRCVTREDLVAVGLPKATRMVNDMVAGAEGVLGELEGAGEALTPLHDPAECDPDSGSIVFLAPGTGLGAATLVRTGLADPTHVAMGCECQHTVMPAFADDMEEPLSVLGQIVGHPPTWEEVVSGRGIVRVHAALQAIEFGTTPEDPADSDASGIAEAARGGDGTAARALTIYYRTLGHFAQLLALSAQPCAGVFVGGASTAKNIEILREGGFADEFADNGFVGQALAEVPVYVVEGDMNLAGGLRIAAHAARSRPPKAQFRSFAE